LLCDKVLKNIIFKQGFKKYHFYLQIFNLKINLTAITLTDTDVFLITLVDAFSVDEELRKGVKSILTVKVAYEPKTRLC
jgi:hypothetical protein